MKLIIVTGSKGSGKTEKAKELSLKNSYRKPYESEKSNAIIYEYPTDKPKEGKLVDIVVVQKDLLCSLLNELGNTKYEILDLDFN